MAVTTPYVGATTVQELAAALQKMSYTPRTEEQRRAQAEALYKNSLEQALLSAQQTYDQSDLALANQLGTLATSAERQARTAQKNTAAAVSAADRNALSRGMQRSSYNLSRMANIQNQGNQTLADIEQSRTDAENSIAAQRALLSQQLAQNTASARSQYENSVLNRMNELEQQDYERGIAADTNNNNTQLQLYSAQQADAQRAQAQNQFELSQALQREQLAQNQNQFDLNLAFEREKLAQDQAQFDAQMAFNKSKLGGTSSSGSGSRSTRSYVPTTNNNPGNDDKDTGTDDSGRDYKYTSLLDATKAAVANGVFANATANAAKNKTASITINKTTKTPTSGSLLNAIQTNKLLNNSLKTNTTR